MGNRPLRVTFALQGEGRGHMTQALTLAGHLRAAGHTVDQVWVGLGPGWEIPDFFREQIGAPITTFVGPTHQLNRARTGVSASRTAWVAIKDFPAFVRSARRRRREISSENTDVLVGFYDAIGGMSRLMGQKVPAVAIGHHYVLFHELAPVLPLGRSSMTALRLLTRLTGRAAHQVLALSFADLDSQLTTDSARPKGPGSSVDRPAIVPPLLRPAVTQIEPTDDGHLLAYAVAPGVGDRIVSWQRTRSEVTTHIYLAGGSAALTTKVGPGCHVHDLDDQAFLRHMGSCHAFAGSAGFESLCEAFYLGKPILAVPTPGQIEQQLNAADGERAGLIRAGDWDDLDDFWTHAQTPDPVAVAEFRQWVDAGPGTVVARVEAAGGRPERLHALLNGPVDHDKR